MCEYFSFFLFALSHNSAAASTVLTAYIKINREKDDALRRHALLPTERTVGLCRRSGVKSPLVECFWFMAHWRQLTTAFTTALQLTSLSGHFFSKKHPVHLLTLYSGEDVWKPPITLMYLICLTFFEEVGTITMFSCGDAVKPVQTRSRSSRLFTTQCEHTTFKPDGTKSGKTAFWHHLKKGLLESRDVKEQEPVTPNLWSTYTLFTREIKPACWGTLCRL